VDKLTPETLLEYIEYNWSREDIAQAMRGLRDIAMRLDKKRELRHHILSDKDSAAITITFTEDKELSEFLIHSLGDTVSSINFSLSKKQIADLAVFLYYAIQEPKTDV